MKQLTDSGGGTRALLRYVNKWAGNDPIRNATSIWKEKYFIQTQVGLYSRNEVIWTIEDDILVKIAINFFIFVLFQKSKKNEYLVFVCYDAI